MQKRIISILFMTAALSAQTLHVHPSKGDDANPGTREAPLKTLARAARHVNAHTNRTAANIILHPGIYAIRSTVLFDSSRTFTPNQRLTIRAAHLPGDSAWTPGAMPIILSTQNAVPASGETPVEVTALKIETSHVTIKGLKFLGSPVTGIWYYPLFREGTSLTDLEVSQCFFIMDGLGTSANVGVLANGHETSVHHCVFKGCSNPVVFWRATGGLSRKNAMHHCIITDAVTSAVWVCDTADDLEFHHNVVSRVKYVWMRDLGNTRTYRLSDCLLTDYEIYSGQCGNNWTLSETGSDVVYDETDILRSGAIQLETGQGLDSPMPDDFLQLKPGSPGSRLKAGLIIMNDARE